MKLISSRTDTIIKRLFPAIWFLVLGVLVISGLVDRHLDARTVLLHLFLPVMVGVAAYRYVKGAQFGFTPTPILGSGTPVPTLPIC